MTRRRFAFWLGFGLFTLSDKLRVYGLDDLAAAALGTADPGAPEVGPAELPIHWTAVENNSWRWFERETFIDGKWKLTGVTVPLHKQTGEPHTEVEGYLDDILVPAELRNGTKRQITELPAEIGTAYSSRKPHPDRKARHGRPPSKWLRKLNADEIRIWLKTIEVPAAGVSGMTYWEHLTRDHSFDATKIEGLTIDELAKLHAAAHNGY